MTQNSKVIVSAIIWSGKKILLLKRKNNFKELSIGIGIWDLPGGTVEFGEQLNDALHRELIEETSSISLNNTISLTDAIAYTLQDASRIIHRINIIYSIEIKYIPLIKLSEEHSEYRFIENADEIQKLEMMQPIKEFITSQINKHNNF